MDQDVLKTLFLPFSPQHGNVLFINGITGPWIHDYPDIHWVVYQPLHGLFHAFPKHPNIVVLNDLNSIGTIGYDTVCILAPKDKAYTRFLMAYGLSHLSPEGTIIVAADNKAGGSSLKKDLENLCSNVLSDSKNKAKVVWANKTSFHDNEMLREWLSGSELRSHPTTGFYTYPGIYGWDKIDKGSSLLIEHIPNTLKGTGADFGAGYGLLSIETFKKGPQISRIDAYEHDYRAVIACRKNCETSQNISVCWQDLSGDFKSETPYDWIIMNPPFHDHHKTAVDLGHNFISSANRNLKPGGALYMVANKTLPYESVLTSLLKGVETVCEHNGFKIFRALR